jgi:hypothetical protein
MKARASYRVARLISRGSGHRTHASNTAPRRGLIAAPSGPWAWGTPGRGRQPLRPAGLAPPWPPQPSFCGAIEREMRRCLAVLLARPPSPSGRLSPRRHLDKSHRRPCPFAALLLSPPHPLESIAPLCWPPPPSRWASRRSWPCSRPRRALAPSPCRSEPTCRCLRHRRRRRALACQAAASGGDAPRANLWRRPWQQPSL